MWKFNYFYEKLVKIIKKLDIKIKIKFFLEKN